MVLKNNIKKKNRKVVLNAFDKLDIVVEFIIFLLLII